MKKFFLREEGQISLEMLLLALVILLLSASILSYYIQIGDSSMAMYLLDTETLKAIDEANEVVVKEGMEYRIDNAASSLELCLFTRSTSGNPLLNAAERANIEDFIEANTNFSTVNLYENPGSPTPCE